VNGSIEIVTGTLGGGKSLFAVERIYFHLLAGGWVYTNIEMHHAAVAAEMADHGVEFEPDRLVLLTGPLAEFHTLVSRGDENSNVMVVIDEAHLGFNSRDWAKTNRDLLDFNSCVRKLDILLLYITQDITNLDKQFRKLAGIQWMCRNMAKPPMKLLGVIPVPIPLLFRIPFNKTVGNDKGVAGSPQIVGSTKWVWKLYNSDALLGESRTKMETMRKVSAKPLKRIKKTNTNSLLPEMAALLCASFFGF
jgi:hypothetical protein